ncbi:MAG: inositol monophosphatase [Dehalococcoidia bacterium]|nr:inositol monophosphatase [Dehalococcoidia bacterium]
MQRQSPPHGASGAIPRQVAEDLVREAGAVAVERFTQGVEVTFKGWRNVVTATDYEIDRLITARLLQEFPGWGILSEESPPVDGGDSGLVWVVDPIDGTKNFSQGMPTFAVNLALVDRGTVVLALTYDPNRDELFLAERGAGASLNGKPMHVSSKTLVEECLIGFDMGYDNERAKQLLDFLGSLWPAMQGMRNIGSAALGLAYAASGRTDLYLHSVLSPWDFVPGLLLVQEAGGIATERDGSALAIGTHGIIAANAAVHADLMRLATGNPWQRAGLE